MFLETVFHNMEEGVFCLDAKGRFVWVNEAICHTLGYTQAQMLRKSVFDINPIYATAWERHWQELKNQKKLVLDITHLSHEQVSLDVRLRIFWIEAEGQEFACAMAKVLTPSSNFLPETPPTAENPQAAYKSSQSFENQLFIFKKIFEQARDVICVVDAETGQFLEVNRAASQRWGYTRAQLLKMKGEHIHPHQAQTLISFSKKVMQEGFGWSNELSCLTAQGHLLEAEVSASLMLLDGRKCIVMIVHDTSTHARNERILQAKNYELKMRQNKIEQQRALLQSQKSDLEALNQTKDRFFSIIAHDLKSPLNSLQGYLNLITASGQALSPREIRQIGQKLQQSFDNTQNLLHNLLEWARTQTREFPYHPQWLCLEEILDENLALFAGIAEQKNNQLTKAHSTSGLRVYADAQAIRTILRNLVNNALKFTHPGGQVHLSISDTSQQSIKLAVQDTGIGMDEATLAHLFRMDRKVSLPGTNKEKGTGLGLILCQELAKMNQAQIQVKSQAGVGSVFELLFPAQFPASNKK